jgi:hypothetical protein
LNRVRLAFELQSIGGVTATFAFSHNHAAQVCKLETASRVAAVDDTIIMRSRSLKRSISVVRTIS